LRLYTVYHCLVVIKKLFLWKIAIWGDNFSTCYFYFILICWMRLWCHEPLPHTQMAEEGECFKISTRSDNHLKSGSIIVITLCTTASLNLKRSLTFRNVWSLIEWWSGPYASCVRATTHARKSYVFNYNFFCAFIVKQVCGILYCLLVTSIKLLKCQEVWSVEILQKKSQVLVCLNILEFCCETLTQYILHL
jgi:hypothetical protein